MEQLGFLTDDQLLRFFHRNKTEMSLMKDPQLFLNVLRDHDLIPEDRYKKLSRMKSKGNFINALYEFLDWLEAEKSQHIQDFWRCVFKENIMGYYPTLKRLHDSLLDGSFTFAQRDENGEKQDIKSEMKECLDEETIQTGSVKKKKKRKRTISSDDKKEAEPIPSTTRTPSRKKRAGKPLFSSPLKKGEKGDIWTWPIYKRELPVKCGNVEGTLRRDKLAKGEKCIVVEKRWFTPGGFEKFAGKESSRNWKASIQCMGTPLLKLIQDGHLNIGNFRKGPKKAKKLLFPSHHLVSDSEDEEGDGQTLASCLPDDTDEEMSAQAEESTKARDRGKMVFDVRCGEQTAVLHKKRFARGNKGKCIRTDTCWMYPEEFAMQALGESGTSWRKDITYEGQPLSVLLEDVLEFHSVLCLCSLCQPEQKDLENEMNDDECCVCKSDQGGNLVECDHCPRSFHLNCHLPVIDEDTVSVNPQWMCTFCILKTAQDCQYSDIQQAKVPMSNPISPHLLECQYLILYLYSADTEQMFALDPTCFINDYCKFIRTPMWLGKVGEQLQGNHYSTVGQFVADVRLIFSNSSAYNQKNTEFLAMGHKMSRLFEEKLKEVFKIHD